MRETKNARPVAATTEQAAEIGTARRAVTFSNFDCTTAEQPCQMGFVSRHLRRGRANAIPGRQLVELLGLPGGRALTRQIERERRAGAPICAVCGENRGYYLADSPTELQAYLRSLDARLRSVGKTRQSLGDLHDRWVGQQRVEG